METTCRGSGMSREAMQMALDMLNEIADDVYCDQKLEGVITALRHALETEQEPFEYWNAVEGWVKIDELRQALEADGGNCYGDGTGLQRATKQG